MHEQSDKHLAVERIMSHPSNQGRDPHTLKHLRRVLKEKTMEGLCKIEDLLRDGELLPDNFR